MRLSSGYQPDPPPPPPPPPDEPPPPEPLLLLGDVDADDTVLASEDPTVFAKPPGSSQKLLLPLYQPTECAAVPAAAASTLANLSAHRFSTSSAIA